MMKKTIRIAARMMLMTALAVVLTLWNKADIMADAPHTLSVTVDPAAGGSVSASVNGNPIDPSTAQCDAGSPINVVATPNGNYRFGEWTSNGIDTSSLDLNQPSISFTMPTNDVTIAAHFIENESEPEPAPATDSAPEPETSGEETADSSQEMSNFFDSVKNQVEDTLKNLQNVANDPAALAELKKNGLTIDAGTWESFDFATCNALDELIKRGVPVTIQYKHNADTKSITIPANFMFTLKQMCDYSGFVGFEYINAAIANVELGKEVLPEKAIDPANILGSKVSNAAILDAYGIALDDISWTSAKDAATIAAEKAEKQQAAGTQMAAVQTLLRTIATTKPTDGPGEAPTVINLDMTKLDILDRDTVNLLVRNNKFGYNIRIPVTGGLTTTVKVPANFNFRPFIKADGTMNINEVLWSIILSRK